MPIGTSDGEHFDDEFHQAVSKYIPTPTPDPRGRHVTSDMVQTHQDGGVRTPAHLNPYFDPSNPISPGMNEFVEDSRDLAYPKPDLAKKEGLDKLANEEGWPDHATKQYYINRSQDLSRFEKNPLSIQAGINDIPISPKGSAMAAYNRGVITANSGRSGINTSGISENVQKVLEDPRIQEAINNPKIDRSHDVPYEAGASNKPDDLTTHIDKRIPTSVDIDGKTFDPAIPANIHEQVEREVMERLIKFGFKEDRAYEIAHHEYAEPAEDMWYRQQGINIDKVNEWWSKQDKITEHENPANPPPDLYTKPYPHNKVEGVAHEPTGVYAEWPTTTSTQLAMNILTPGSERSSSDKPMEKLMTGFPARSAAPGPINPKTAPDVPGTINPAQLGKVIKSPKVKPTPEMQDEMLRQGITEPDPKTVNKLSPREKKDIARQTEAARGDIEQFKRENRMIAEPSQIQQSRAEDLMARYKGDPREEDVLSQKLEQLRIRSANYGEALIGKAARSEMKLIRSRLKEIPTEQDAKKLNEFSKSMLKKE